MSKVDDTEAETAAAKTDAEKRAAEKDCNRNVHEKGKIIKTNETTFG